MLKLSIDDDFNNETEPDKKDEVCQLKVIFRPQWVICNYLDEVDTLDDVDIDDDVDTELEVDTLKRMKNDYLRKIEKCPKKKRSYIKASHTQRKQFTYKCKQV